ncbi:carboxymuconolactone decarboxylase family protein [Bacillus sp. BRMEA1]|uniref:carboxymuconolactone decarboxylase family protein n=1 Tax=Neobacillus endophyticus TaxID=2738405 RepID=UPI0015648702|nr:carboxymuconolactone decarboxylase family protein [Neobacillus endophyticus]NRD79880.1 carboxymuconolactone decarboxylase family protein [Neobacillus endophyticus]
MGNPNDLYKGDDVLYRNSYLKRINELIKLAPAPSKAFLTFEKEAFVSGLISTKTKELIAIAVAHTTGCPYCIDVHVNKYKKYGGTMVEVMEAIIVASAVKAGAALSHGVNALNSYEKNNML